MCRSGERRVGGVLYIIQPVIYFSLQSELDMGRLVAYSSILKKMSNLYIYRTKYRHFLVSYN
jgi:hypothetical protein